MDNLESTYKFDTCRYRSAEAIQFGSLSCCGKMPDIGFLCYERNIEGLTPVVCERCDFYEKRLMVEGDSGDNKEVS